MNKLKDLYNWSPALVNAVIAAVLMLVNHFAPDYDNAVKGIIDALLAMIAGGVTYTQVTPVAKLKKEGLVNE